MKNLRSLASLYGEHEMPMAAVTVTGDTSAGNVI